MDEGSEYVLGRGITKQARGRENRTTTIISVRLSAEEMDTLFKVAKLEGKTTSQVVREAIRQLQSPRREVGWAALSYLDGRSFIYGTGREVTAGAPVTVT